MKQGFTLNVGRKEFFYVTNRRNINDKVAEKFVDKLGEINNLPAEFIEKCKADSATMKDLKRRIMPATLEKRNTGKIEYFNLRGKCFSISIPMEDLKCLVVFE